MQEKHNWVKHIKMQKADLKLSQLSSNAYRSVKLVGSPL